MPIINLTLDHFSDELPDDCDRINVVIEGGHVGATEVSLRLGTQPNMWKKRISVTRLNGVSTLETEDGGTTHAVILQQSELTTASLLFVKAKAFGNMIPLYTLPGAELAPLLGRVVTFQWFKDHC